MSDEQNWVLPIAHRHCPLHYAFVHHPSIRQNSDRISALSRFRSPVPTAKIRAKVNNMSSKTAAFAAAALLVGLVASLGSSVLAAHQGREPSSPSPSTTPSSRGSMATRVLRPVPSSIAAVSPTRFRSITCFCSRSAPPKSRAPSRSPSTRLPTNRFVSSTTATVCPDPVPALIKRRQIVARLEILRQSQGFDGTWRPTCRPILRGTSCKAVMHLWIFQESPKFVLESKV